MSYRFDRLNDCITALRSYKTPNFSMDTYLTSCGTPACVLGHYATKYYRRELKLTLADDMAHRPSATQIQGPVAEHFGISEREKEQLFSFSGCNSAQTRYQAINYIKKFIKTRGGKVTA